MKTIRDSFFELFTNEIGNCFKDFFSNYEEGLCERCWHFKFCLALKEKEEKEKDPSFDWEKEKLRLEIQREEKKQEREAKDRERIRKEWDDHIEQRAREIREKRKREYLERSNEEGGIKRDGTV